MLKVLLADDEESIRTGLRKIIDWETCGYEICGEAANGQEAAEQIKRLHPDLVILDIRMPGMSGIDVLKTVSDQEKTDASGKKTKFIILSGYSDFQYAQEALNHGACGYLVKPVDEEELQEKVIAIAEEASSADASGRTVDIRARFGQMFLFGLVEDAFEDSYADANDYQVALFSLKKSGLKSDLTGLEKITADAFSGMDMFTVIYGENVAAVFRNCKEDAVSRNMARFTAKLTSAPFAALGRKRHSLEGALKSFTECKDSMPQLFFLPDHEFARTETVPEKASPFSFKSLIPDTIFCIETYDKNRLAQLLSDACRYLSVPSGDRYKCDAVKTQCIEYITQLQTGMQNKYPEREFENISAYDLVPRILSAERFKDVWDIVTGFSGDFLECFNTNTASSTITKVIQYVKNNCAGDLKLETLGQLFYCNSAYLGKKFREQTGMQFNAYLDKIRIEEAKEKLENTDLKIYQISKLVGYANTDYFFLKFRKYTGMTPKEYKTQCLNKNKKD
jgi:two-component system response regulator YesN